MVGVVGSRGVLLDTNVWRYLVDAGEIESLRSMAKLHGVRVIAAPAVLYECLRTGDADTRRSLVKAVTRSAWGRPMPEVFAECEAVVAEMRRARPHWFRAEPDLRAFAEAARDWQSRGIWRRARTDPAAAAKVLREVEGVVVDQARDEMRRSRQNMLEQGDVRHDLREVRCSTTRMAGYDGRRVECWRFQSRAVYTAILFGRRTDSLVPTSHQDWISPFVDLDLVHRDQAAWNRFWLFDAQTTALPREWMRWAMTQAQSLRRPSPGAPVDNQISGYLLDCDEVVTGDRVFAEILDGIRAASDFVFARTVVVPAGREGALATLAHIAAKPSAVT